MDESYAIRRYEQAAALLPLRWQQQARQLARGRWPWQRSCACGREDP